LSFSSSVDGVQYGDEGKGEDVDISLEQRLIEIDTSMLSEKVGEMIKYYYILLCILIMYHYIFLLYIIRYYYILLCIIIYY
jgi:hypothetical protein